MRRVKVIGAGSIGNHHAQAARRMGWSVDVVDSDPKALQRMKEDIYPKRYGAWDDSIGLYQTGGEPKQGYDVICIGTPPDVRMKIALSALEERPKALLLEKPLCGPYHEQMEALREFHSAYRGQIATKAVVGYDHAIARSTQYVSEILKRGLLGAVQAIDVQFREHWRGIFSAHPWLAGPGDTYLGYTARGGGASGEHSHALHLWQFFARRAGFGVPHSVSGLYKAVDEIERDAPFRHSAYDTIALFSILTDIGNVGYVAQDVVTHPSRKWARIQGTDGFVEWICNGASVGGDLVRMGLKDDPVLESVFPKTRPDDFHQEMLHINDIMNNEASADDSPLSLDSGILVMQMLSAVATHQYGTMQTIGW